MAATPYATIRDKIKDILEGDARTKDSRVFVEEEPQFGVSDFQGVIAVFTERRRAPVDQQPLAYGKRTRFLLDMLFAVIFMHMGSYKEACDGRDEILGNLELVLMDNRTLSSTVETLWLEGGEFYSAKHADSGAFIAVAEVNVTVMVSAVNT